MPTNTTRPDWLASLQVGDEVCLTDGRTPEVARVTRITPTRRFQVTRGTFKVDLNTEGLQTGKRSWYPYRIEPLTAKVLEQIERRGLLDSLGRVKWMEWPTETLRQVKALLEEHGLAA